jgi:hypothetical protein
LIVKIRDGGVELGQMESLPDLISNLPIPIQYLIALLLALAILKPAWLIAKAILWWPMSKLWPGRDGWSAECIPKEKGMDTDDRLNPNRAWESGSAERWCQMRMMKVGDYYNLDIAKPRVISRIKLICKEHSYPMKYELRIKQDDNHPWEDGGIHDSGNGGLGYMEVNLDKPRKLKGLSFIITEPRINPRNVNGQPPAWSIFDIVLTEMRLFGKWWGKEIKR